MLKIDKNTYIELSDTGIPNEQFWNDGYAVMKGAEIIIEGGTYFIIVYKKQ